MHVRLVFCLLSAPSPSPPSPSRSQRGEEALKADNVFFPLTYEGAVGACVQRGRCGCGREQRERWVTDKRPMRALSVRR